MPIATWNVRSVKPLLPLICAALGLLMAVFIWQGAPLDLDEPDTVSLQDLPDLPVARFSFDDGLRRSPVVRLTPFSCNIWLQVNRTNLRDLLYTRGPDGKYACDHDPFTLDLSPYLQAGDNQIFLARPEGTPHVRSLHSTAQMLLIAACLLLYPLYRGAATLWQRRKTLLAAAGRNAPYLALGAALLATAAYLRLHFLPFMSEDYKLWLAGWLDFIRHLGLHSAYGHRFTNYTPLYTYLLGLFDLYFPTLPTLYAIKGATFAGEALAAFWAYRLLALHDGAKAGMPMIAACLLLLLPTVLINGAITGQCDIWWVAFLLAALYYTIADRPWPAMIYAGLAFSFKLQAVFLSPLLLAMLLKKRLPWTLLWVPPGVYALTCLPALLEGRSVNTLFIYFLEANRGTLNYSAANPSLFGFHLPFLSPVATGSLLGLVCGAGIAALTWRRGPQTMTLPQYLLLATLCAALMPYVLPHMHDRYFFAADIFSFLLACLRPRWWPLPALLQAASALAPPKWQSPLFAFIPHNAALYIAFALNSIALLMLLYLCARYVWKKAPLRDRLPAECPT